MLFGEQDFEFNDLEAGLQNQHVQRLIGRVRLEDIRQQRHIFQQGLARGLSLRQTIVGVLVAAGASTDAARSATNYITSLFTTPEGMSFPHLHCHGQKGPMV